MDLNGKTLNPVNTSLTAHTHQNFNPPIESGRVAVDFWPGLPIWDQQSVINVYHSEYPSFKKPRTTQTTMNSTLGIPFKTDLCFQFKRGRCTYGDNCHFAHGIGDNTRMLLPQKQELMKKEEGIVVRNWDEDRKIITAMKLCRRFCNGEECPYGESCHFLHEKPEKFRKALATRIGTGGHGGLCRNGCDQLECRTVLPSSLSTDLVSQKPVFWKTRLCKKWEVTRNCPFGGNCCFAHGHSELQKVGSMEHLNVSTSKMIPVAATHLSPGGTGNGVACETLMQGKKCLFKWRRFDKISRIYADWIDDLPLVQSSLAKVEG
ncbi:hypothetical protein U1Q18_006703 [Sarracenia purpurea var. burkii]